MSPVNFVLRIMTWNKKFVGWTANSENTIQRNLRCKVNGIITDNPELTRYYVDEQMENLTLNLLTDLFFPDSQNVYFSVHTGNSI